MSDVRRVCLGSKDILHSTNALLYWKVCFAWRSVASSALHPIPQKTLCFLKLVLRPFFTGNSGQGTGLATKCGTDTTFFPTPTTTLLPKRQLQSQTQKPRHRKLRAFQVIERTNRRFATGSSAATHLFLRLEQSRKFFSGILNQDSYGISKNKKKVWSFSTLEKSGKKLFGLLMWKKGIFLRAWSFDMHSDYVLFRCLW